MVLACGFVEPEVGFEPTTFRLRVKCSASNWTVLGGSCLLTLGALSAQTAQDGYRRIVWMIKQMIKRIRQKIGWQGEIDEIEWQGGQVYLYRGAPPRRPAATLGTAQLGDPRGPGMIPSEIN